MIRKSFLALVMGLLVGVGVVGVAIGTRERTAQAQSVVPPGFVQLACAQPPVSAAYAGFCAAFAPPTAPPITPVPTATPCPFFLCPPTPGPTPVPGPMTVQVIARHASGVPLLPGTTIAASVGGVACASAQTASVFSVTLLSLPPSCGAAGAAVTFTVGGVAVPQGTTFQPGGSVAILLLVP